MRTGAHTAVPRAAREQRSSSLLIIPSPTHIEPLRYRLGQRPVQEAEPELEAPQAPPSPFTGASSLVELLLPPDSANSDSRVASFEEDQQRRIKDS